MITVTSDETYALAMQHNLERFGTKHYPGGHRGDWPDFPDMQADLEHDLEHADGAA